jgi:hypothetical protein
MFFLAGIGMTLPISLIGLGIAAAYSVWLMLKGFPIAWGIAIAIYCLWYMGGAYKMMAFLNGEGGVRTNAAAAGCLPFAIHLILALYFMTSEWSSRLSAWWALLLPLTFLLHLLLQALLESILNLVYPAGRRK